MVDDVYTEHSHVAGSFTMLASSRAHVGGSLNARALPGARVHTNFIGCLKKVTKLYSMLIYVVARMKETRVCVCEQILNKYVLRLENKCGSDR